MMYKVLPNSCRCHPETCCCNDWAIFTGDGEKHSSYFHIEIAEEVVAALNSHHEPKPTE